ncbi:hypothetical protein EVAR_28889_1 [Eumeta japonica]|uniref:Uncharacterized protein n=1 Tax=Eumeta variegata TaxID=151549 RepID=A0A4C1X1S4_EUMVA|nr:hypothetical protein EVAR_28889_1 [Eumeta japonica]
MRSDVIRSYMQYSVPRCGQEQSQVSQDGSLADVQGESVNLGGIYRIEAILKPFYFGLGKRRVRPGQDIQSFRWIIILIGSSSEFCRLESPIHTELRKRCVDRVEIDVSTRSSGKQVFARNFAASCLHRSISSPYPELRKTTSSSSSGHPVQPHLRCLPIMSAFRQSSITADPYLEDGPRMLHPEPLSIPALYPVE